MIKQRRRRPAVSGGSTVIARFLVLQLRVRERGVPEGRAAFSKSLAALTAGMSPAEKRRVIAIFLAIYSAPFWGLLRKRGGLSGADAVAAAEWGMNALIQSLRKRSTPTSNGRKR
jgi:hypothetical protein